ncbi:tripartite tricarboxylate transporter substrate binding protein [Achromobacter denitrificans]|uniref:Bug family tripartite tricarboxylate transporter substrate binding protein n=1 Tax=Achromobacter denitrificans TaxID=32002 RepID=UPI0023E856D9|nr:tripartite tricarboxylate transporter substrate binding protein [Achromobacter denitrificans]MDF3942856.1 tripartite tricarboxylate transporter substrate binding protein [Achromobacter denitrificans]
MAIAVCTSNFTGSRPRGRGFLKRAVAALALFAAAAGAGAADFPQRSLQLILSFPPGGATDVLARELSQKLGDTLGQSVVVLNRPGAGGLIGMQAAARSEADGYTLYISSVMSNSIYEALNGKQQVSLDGDFEAVGAIASAPHILVTPSMLGIKDYASLVSYLKAAPGKYNYASMGAGTLSNLEGEIFKEQAGVDALQIPYKGSSQALPEVISGASVFMFDSVTSSLPHKQGGRIEVLGVASAKRLPVMPEVPTLKELGVQGLEAENLFALMAPKGTPRDRLDIVARALAKAQDDAGFRKAIEAQGFQVSEIPGASLPRFILDQQAFWRDKVKALNITAGK